MRTHKGLLKDNKQRLFDLVRYCRGELFEEDLITKDEFSELVFSHGSVDRLESYDQIRARLKEVEAELACVKKQLDAANVSKQ